MKTLLLLAALLIPSAFVSAEECTDYMQAFNKHQLVIKGMMDLNFQGKMNSQVGDAIGKRMKEAQEPLDSGDYDKACNIYDSIIADYGFDTSFGEAPTQETTESISGGGVESTMEAKPAEAASSSAADEASSDGE
ncbi:MAG: hypothetical protein AAF462_10975 [Thermodesulfobacteriota bacterium]